MGERTGTTRIAPQYRSTREAVQQMSDAELAALESGEIDEVDLEPDAGAAPAVSSDSSAMSIEDTSAEMSGFEDGRDAMADPDGDFSDDEDVENGPLDQYFDAGPTAQRTRQADLRFEPRMRSDGSIGFDVRVSGAGHAEVSPNDDLADIIRERTELVARLGSVLVARQHAFLEAVLRGEPWELADTRLVPLTQQDVVKASGLDKDAVSRLANAAYAEVGCAGAPGFVLAKLMARSRTLGVHPDALRAHVKRIASGVTSAGALREQLFVEGVLRRPNNPPSARSVREHIRQVCASLGIVFEGPDSASSDGEAE